MQTNAVHPSTADLPRLRWLRRIALMTLGLSAIVLALRLIAGIVADRRAAAQLVHLRELGFATRVDDLAPPAIADAQNAGPLWTQAFAALSANNFSPRQSSFDDKELGAYPPYTAKWHQLADASEQANASIFALADKARARPDCNWGTQYVSGAYVWSTSRLSPARGLANALCDSFERNHLLGDDATAMNRLLAAIALADALRRESNVVSVLIGTGIDDLVCDALRRNIGSLRIDDADPRAAHAAQVRALLEWLFSDSSQLRFAAAVRAEVTIRRDELNTLMTSHRWELWAILPTIEKEFDRIVDRQAAAARLPLETIGPARLAAVAGYVRQQERLDAAVDHNVHAPEWLLGSLGIYSTATYTGRGVLVQDNVAACRHIAAIALAMRWFQLEHQSRLPERLDALMPLYLPAIPINPLSPRGLPFEYVIVKGGLSGGDRPLLFVDMPDAVRGEIPSRPSYEVYYTPARSAHRDDSRGRCTDLTSWTPTQEQIDAAAVKESSR